MGPTTRLLFDERPLVLNPSIVRALRTLPGFDGISEALVLQQVHYWVIQNQRAGRNEHDGYFWTYNTFKQWAEEGFDGIWSLATVKRIFKRLESSGLVITGRFNKANTDRTKWYRINYDSLDRLFESINLTPSIVSSCDLPKCQPDTMQSTPLTLSGQAQVTNENEPPENTREYHQRLSDNKQRALKLHSRWIFAEMQKELGYPDKLDKDPIPNYGKEAKAIDRMLRRGYSEEDILEFWRGKVRKRDEFVSMTWVNEDIGKPERTGPRQGNLFNKDDSSRYFGGKLGHLVHGGTEKE